MTIDYIEKMIAEKLKTNNDNIYLIKFTYE